jgi:pyruvate-formate lyase-activating enzyme
MPETAMESPVVTVAVMVTRRCNMACAHCSVESSSKIRAQPSEADLERYVNEIADAGARAVLFTGGEPMIREKLVVRLMSIAKKRGLVSAITTNGFWGKTLPDARRTIASMCKAGLGFFTLSYDRYHAEFQGPEPGKNILRAAEELGVPMNLNVTRIANDSEIGELIRPFEMSKHAKVRLYDVQPVGRALDLPSSSLRSEVVGACEGARLPAITDDGRMTACNGPAYFQPPESPLNLGSLENSSVKSLLEKHRDDPILQTIRIFGPSRLRDELSQIEGFENFPWRSSYAGLCDLCTHINSNAEAAAALRTRLSDPKLVAERTARSRVMQGVAARGRSGRVHSIGPGSARLWMSGASGANLANPAQWTAEAERVLGRADNDWRQVTSYLSACGLSRVVLPIASHPAVARWAPAMFRERLAADALREGRRELVQRTVIDILDEELHSLGVTGVLLKGAAFLARDLAPGDGRSNHVRLTRRSCNDIDIVVPPRVARELWSRLSKRGGEEKPAGMQTGPHHLPPVLVNGMPVEIHTRIMPSFWRLPETDMLSRATRLAQYRALSTLDTEGMMLHALMHCASHVFGCGLKSAWDVAWLMERQPEIDVERLRDWVDRCAMPSGFYLPAAVIRHVLDVPVPSSLLGMEHRTSRFEALERVLRQRMFIAMEDTSELNPITKHGMFMLLHTTWSGRILHMSSLFGKHEREARVAARKSSGPLREFSLQLRESALQLKGFRKTLAAARSDARDEQAALLFDA